MPEDTNRAMRVGPQRRKVGLAWGGSVHDDGLARLLEFLHGCRCTPLRLRRASD